MATWGKTILCGFSLLVCEVGTITHYHTAYPIGLFPGSNRTLSQPSYSIVKENFDLASWCGAQREVAWVGVALSHCLRDEEVSTLTHAHLRDSAGGKGRKETLVHTPSCSYSWIFSCYLKTTSWCANMGSTSPLAHDHQWILLQWGPEHAPPCTPPRQLRVLPIHALFSLTILERNHVTIRQGDASEKGKGMLSLVFNPELHLAEQWGGWQSLSGN